MKKFNTNYLLSIRVFMVLLNFINIIFFASIILLTTKYIISNQMARDFLDKLEYLPQNPVKVFFISIMLFVLLVIIMYVRQKDKEKVLKANFAYSFLEIVLCFLIIYMLYMGYNGIVLLVFADIVYHMKDNKNTLFFLGILILVFLLSNYNIVSMQIPMASMDNYISVYDATTRSSLFMVKGILESLNLVLFILFMIVYIANQIKENENITQELSMIHEVNQGLQEYAAVTEKIGEDRERKRLAREIHDTLGHALTGIAAGIDACIAMIDGHPKETKEQLFVISKVVRQGIGDVRGSLNKLRPGALEKHTFKEAINKMVKEFSDVSDLQINVNYELKNIDFENTKEDVLFRIIQESITNTLRHGNSSLVTIHLYQEEQTLFLKIKDNGTGCKDIVFGFGLQQMQERVSIINGEVTFDGTNGFSTVVKIPMKRGEYYD